MKRLFVLSTILFCATFALAQQRFFNLTKDQVQIEYTVPHVGWAIDLPEDYEDSIYTVELLYPEYIDMAPSDVEKYNEITDEPLPEKPAVNYSIGYSMKKPQLMMDVCPFACSNGKYKILAGFMLKVDAKAKSTNKSKAPRKEATAADRYAEHSVLASGNWVKIRVSGTGIYQISESLIKQAGFTDINKVKVYGYGGNLQNEKFVAQDLINTDDLKEVSQCVVDGKHLFYAKGPVSWASKTSANRTRNPYSSYGYYFLTETDEEQSTVSEEKFAALFYPSNDDYHALYEDDGYAWFQGGRNLYDSNSISAGSSKTVTLQNNAGSTTGTLYVSASSSATSTILVELNGETFCTLNVNMANSSSSYDVAKLAYKTAAVSNLVAENKVKFTVNSGGPVRIDYVALTLPDAAPMPNLSTTSFPVPEYVHKITNQDHHADTAADMVIIIPTSQKLLSQATRLKTFHEENDGMRINIVPADELYNEFSSGTPDANAYRRYLKMLYDRSGDNKADMPKYLLLFGDCVWDNRMLTSATRTLSLDDYLLCFESENSFNHVKSYVDDGWFCLLDDGEGSDPLTKDLLDIGVGRFPVTTDAQAKIMVDKTINYVKNQNIGAWQNTIMLMGDDGNNNIHMDDAESVAEQTEKLYPGYLIKKVMWDVYNRETSATGNTYPEVTKIVKQQQNAGALIMNYAGHGSEVQISHEAVLNIKDFANFSNTNLPLWITASCDIMPFDGADETIGETAVLNSKGGAVAFYGTTRTVYQNYNKLINLAFMDYLLGKNDEGEFVTIGEAQRLAKNYLLTSGKDREENKLQFSLLGDPAIKLNLPKLEMVVDEINGVKVGGTELPTIKAGSIATFKGHVVTDEPFNGIVNITIHDTKEHIVCRLNNTSSDGADTAFEYDDRTKVLFNGSDSVTDGQFTMSFAVPKDINYANDRGLVTMYAYNDEKTLSAHGCSDEFIVGGADDLDNDGKGPSIYCYLNSPSFVNGGDVNTTPYFVAQLNDTDGLNTSGNGIGHDLQLVIDGKMSLTYNLNSNFTYDFGSYTSGSTYYSIPTLDAGNHTLQFRAWDVFNNSSTTTLDFNVVKALEPLIVSVSCTNNPATTNTTFIVTHDRVDSDVTISLDIMDMSGRILWNHEETSLTSTGSSTIDWDLTVDDGHSLQTGVYLYRVSISSDGSTYASKAKKLIIVK